MRCPKCKAWFSMRQKEVGPEYSEGVNYEIVCKKCGYIKESFVGQFLLFENVGMIN